MEKLVIILGNSGSGKDTTANILKELINEGGFKTCEVVQFASKAKQDVMRLIDPVNPPEYEINKHITYEVLGGMTPVEFLIDAWRDIESPLGRLYDMAKLDEFTTKASHHKISIVTDLRVHSELALVKNLHKEGVEVFTFHIEGRGHPLESDKHLNYFVEELSKLGNFYKIKNNKDYISLLKKLSKYVGVLKKQDII